jgi:hypothetical protein
MNSKLKAIESLDDKEIIKYFPSKIDCSDLLKNSKYLWCVKCKQKLKYCNNCKNELIYQKRIVNSKQKALKYVTIINKKLANKVEENVIKLVLPLKQKYENQIKNKSKDDCISKNIVIYQEPSEEEIKLLDQAYEDLLKKEKMINLKNNNKVVSFSNNNTTIIHLLKKPIRILLDFYKFNYYLPKNEIKNRYLQVINEKVDCKEIINSNRLDILGHLLKFSKHISYLFNIPLKYKIIFRGQYSLLIHRLTNENIILNHQNLNILMVELYINLQTVINNLLNNKNYQYKFDEKLEGCIIYPLILIRQLLLSIFTKSS